ncbi:MAG: nitric-oxide reductase large subunit, partial [Spirochaetes bacterium]|nr:nitric-oxide reductase large subunit [Spirochaetota bacterium]
MKSVKQRAVLLFILGLCFGVLIFGGYMIKKEKPPIPDTVKSVSGEVLFTGKDIMAGQNYYFSRGGQHIGTIWGHGSYLAPDWSADYLHRMGLYLAARYEKVSPDKAFFFTQNEFDNLDAEKKALLTAAVTKEIKTNRLDKDGNLVYTEYQAEAHKALAAYYTALFKDGNDRMGLQPGIVRN